MKDLSDLARSMVEGFAVEEGFVPKPANPRMLRSALYDSALATRVRDVAVDLGYSTEETHIEIILALLVENRRLMDLVIKNRQPPPPPKVSKVDTEGYATSVEKKKKDQEPQDIL